MLDLRRSPFLLALLALVLLAGCDRGAAEQAPGQVGAEAPPEPVTPPFDIRQDSTDLLFTYFDEEGPHTVESLGEVPEARRAQVAVRSLSIAPDARPAPGQVFVADLRAPGPDGRYVVRRYSREAFDRLADEAAGVLPDDRAAPAQGAGATEVVLYGASWCGACRSAAAFLRSRGVPFEEKDIERDAEARDEMTRKMRALGMQPGGIPVIDFRGTLVQGFDRPRLEALIEAPSQAI